uniref:Uncharacterized protein n=1 Tax=Anguilla anguilla TaxID=7936 RepID=A0A0E9T2E6_ANGAN
MFQISINRTYLELIGRTGYGTAYCWSYCSKVEFEGKKCFNVGRRWSRALAI